MKFEMGTELRAIVGHYPNCTGRTRLKAEKGHRCPTCGARVERVETMPVRHRYIEGILHRERGSAPAISNLYGKRPFDPDKDPLTWPRRHSSNI